MQIDLIIKIAVVGILVAVINIVLKNSGREEQGLMVTLAGIVVVLLMVFNEVNNLFESVRTMFGF